MPAGEEKELFPVEYWRLNVGGGEADGMFMSCQLPALSFTNAELRHVGQKASPDTTTINVNHQWSGLSLTRGVDKKGTLWKWIEQGLPAKGGGGSKMEKKIVTVELCNSQDQPVQTWTFTGAWPSGYTGPGLDSNSGSFAVESIMFEFDTAEVKYAEG
jgi:phage tail-like protein